MLWSYGPATLLNIALNLWAVPRCGMFGAAWTAVSCQFLTVVAGWILGSFQFPVWLPAGQAIRCLLAIVPMAVVLTCPGFRRTGSV
jgi:O-antigen/teichoic acid export membrane protein